MLPPMIEVLASELIRAAEESAANAPSDDLKPAVFT